MKRNPNEVVVLVIQDLVSPEETERVFRGERACTTTPTPGNLASPLRPCGR